MLVEKFVLAVSSRLRFSAVLLVTLKVEEDVVYGRGYSGQTSASRFIHIIEANDIHRHSSVFIGPLAVHYARSARANQMPNACPGVFLLEGVHEHAGFALRSTVLSAGQHLDNVEASNVSVHQTSIVYFNHSRLHLLPTKICEFGKAGISVLIGPPSPDLSVIIEMMAAEYDLTFIKYVWDQPKQHYPVQKRDVYSLYPTNDYINLLEKLLDYLAWERVVIVYAKQDVGIFRLFDLINILDGLLFVEVRSLSTSGLADAAKRVKAICDNQLCWASTNRVVVFLDSESSYGFLMAALKLGMIDFKNWFLLVNVDDLKKGTEPYSHNMVRITSMTVWNDRPSRKGISHEVYSKLQNQFELSWRGKFPHMEHCPLKEFVLFFDAVFLAMKLSTNFVKVRDGSTCRSMFKLRQDEGFRHLAYDSLMDKVHLDYSRSRVNTKIFVWELGIDGTPFTTGIWKTDWDMVTQRLSMQDRIIPNSHNQFTESERKKRFLRVTTIDERPYVMEKRLPNGKVVYEGFCVDLLNKLSQYLHFEYKLTVVPDGKYGEPVNGSKEWDVTAGRLEVVDFTDPFLQLGISMLLRQPRRGTPPALTSFLLPLSGSVWFMAAVGTLATTLALTMVAVFSPKESTAEFHLMNSFWYLVCILLRAGSGYNCQSVANRLISTAWWTFTIILIAQYTANFAAVLTIERKTIPFNSFEELGNQSEYTFGSILGGSTMQFFKYSRLDTFKRIWTKMSNTTPSVFVETNDEGVRRALNEKYVFMMESTSLEYQLTQNCNLTRVGNVVLGSNGYSIALPKGSKWREKLTRQILDFNEKGIMMMLKNTWWQKNPQTDSCEDESTETRQSLGMARVSGLFVLLGGGLSLALFVALGEKLLFSVHTRNGVSAIATTRF
uniref:Glutamate receptor n=1 Tax=Steinernema glaseri TaxID=37863 RepID=A0A1I7ZI57_9BILA